MTTPGTLPALLRSALGALERAFVEQGADGLRMPSLDLWANLLRAVDDTSVDSSKLATPLRLSRRAVRTRIALGIRHGWVEQVKTGRGRSTVRLTGRGRDMARRWQCLQTAAEERWCAEIGAQRAGRLRDALRSIVAMLPLEHPHYPASYGPADARITGGNGQDWKPVPREHAGPEPDLPLSALLSQVLVAFAMNYEESSAVALSLTVNILRRIPSEGRAARELGDPVGLAALCRHGFVRTTRDGGKEFVHLTSRGSAASDAHEARVSAVERVWCDQFGKERITALCQALEQVVAKQAGSLFSEAG